MTLIMILNDGETYTNLEGCQIRIMNDDMVGCDLSSEELRRLPLLANFVTDLDMVLRIIPRFNI